MQTNRMCGYPPCSHALRLLQIFSLLLAALSLTAPGIACAQQSETASVVDLAPPASVPAPAPILDEASTDSADEAPAGQNPASQAPASQQSSPDALPPVSTRVTVEPPNWKPQKEKSAPESEISIKGMVSYGNWQIFAAGYHEELYTAGVEYERHSWGYFAGAQMDYAADFLPLVLLREPKVLNPYGIDRSRHGETVYLHGLAFSPIGLRMEWRHDKAFKPYMTVLGGAIGFTKKALSPDASYYDFTLHESIGFYLRMSPRVDMRFGLFGDFHFSNAYVTSYNPGLDVMNSQLAVSYHLRSAAAR